ncbi:hypothetical protein DIPPA_15997 [Diplonema papillatum]|nr:hypothetical protein DIPPA_15997 [Diplonema papillatum]
MKVKKRQHVKGSKRCLPSPDAERPAWVGDGGADSVSKCIRPASPRDYKTELSDHDVMVVVGAARNHLRSRAGSHLHRGPPPPTSPAPPASRQPSESGASVASSDCSLPLSLPRAPATAGGTERGPRATEGKSSALCSLPVNACRGPARMGGRKPCPPSVVGDDSDPEEVVVIDDSGGEEPAAAASNVRRRQASPPPTAPAEVHLWACPPAGNRWQLVVAGPQHAVQQQTGSSEAAANGERPSGTCACSREPRERPRERCSADYGVPCCGGAGAAWNGCCCRAPNGEAECVVLLPRRRGSDGGLGKRRVSFSDATSRASAGDVDEEVVDAEARLSCASSRLQRKLGAGVPPAAGSPAPRRQPAAGELPPRPAYDCQVAVLEQKLREAQLRLRQR